MLPERYIFSHETLTRCARRRSLVHRCEPRLSAHATGRVRPRLPARLFRRLRLGQARLPAPWARWGSAMWAWCSASRSRAWPVPVHDHGAAGPQLRDEDIGNVRFEDGAVDRSVEHEGRHDPILAQAGDNRRGLPVMGWTPPDGI